MDLWLHFLTPAAAAIGALVFAAFLLIFLFLAIIFMFEFSWRLSHIQAAVKHVSETNQALLDHMQRASPEDAGPAP